MHLIRQCILYGGKSWNCPNTWYKKVRKHYNKTARRVSTRRLRTMARQNLEWNWFFFFQFPPQFAQVLTPAAAWCKRRCKQIRWQAVKQVAAGALNCCGLVINTPTLSREGERRVLWGHLDGALQDCRNAGIYTLTLDTMNIQGGGRQIPVDLSGLVM